MNLKGKRGQILMCIFSLLWIRIRIDLAVLDTDPYWDPDPGVKKLFKIN